MTLDLQTEFQPQTEPKQIKKKWLQQIMVIDDDPELLEELRDFLSFNYEVRTLSDSGKAFDAVCEFEPDLIVMDIKMSPKTGFQLANEFRKDANTKSIPIIAITGFFIEKEHTLMMRLFGVKRIIIKPFSLSQLQEQIEIGLNENNPDRN